MKIGTGIREDNSFSGISSEDFLYRVVSVQVNDHILVDIEINFGSRTIIFGRSVKINSRGSWM